MTFNPAYLLWLTRAISDSYLRFLPRTNSFFGSHFFPWPCTIMQLCLCGFSRYWVLLYAHLEMLEFLFAQKLMCSSLEAKPRKIMRVPSQNGVSQAWHTVEIHHSGREPSIIFHHFLKSPSSSPSILCFADLLSTSSHATLLSSALPLSESLSSISSSGFPSPLTSCCLPVTNFTLSALLIASSVDSDHKPGPMANSASSPTCPVTHLALQGQCYDWLALCQYLVTGWDWKCLLPLS